MWGLIDFVAGMGTTGTLMGCSMFFKEKRPSIKIIGVEPTLNHRIQGLKNMNEAIVPKIYDPSRLDSKIICSDEDAFETTRDLSIHEGLFCGVSSGAAMWGALRSRATLSADPTVVVIFRTGATATFQPRSSALSGPVPAVMCRFLP